MELKYTAEELLLDETFIDYCQDQNSVYKMKWEKLIAEYPGQQKAVTEAKELLGLLSPELSTAEITAEVDKLRAMMSSKAENTSKISMDTTEAVLYVSPKGKLRRKRIQRVAVLVLAGIIVSAGLIRILDSGSGTESKQPLAATVYSSMIGERKEINLADGSLVILNSNSQVSVKEDFGKNKREVVLSGEAFFKVAKDPKRPFIVSSAQFSTTALGTAFYVNSRHSPSDYNVTLLEGKVRLNAGGDETAELQAGEEGNWASGGKSFTTGSFDTLYLKQWLSGKISFKKTPLSEALQTLQNWYGVEISDQRKGKKNISINGEYINQSLEDVMKVICFSLSSKYTLSGNKIVIQ